MDQVTQQNAALVEEGAAAAESLRQQAARLAQAVGVFQLGGEVALAPAARPTAPTSGAAGPRGQRHAALEFGDKSVAGAVAPRARRRRKPSPRAPAPTTGKPSTVPSIRSPAAARG